MIALLRFLRFPAAAAVVGALVLAAGFVLFVARLPQAVDDPVSRTDAIVVLTGGSDRVATGIKLLETGLAGQLLISGVPDTVQLRDITMQAPGVAEWIACCITLGRVALDTLGNAEEAESWMRERGFRSLRLVTAHYHMPRSRRLFEHAMPHVEIVPHPVFPAAVRSDSWWRWPGTSRLLAQEYVKYLAALAWTVILPAGTL
ncbi:MAG: YdcF family protein [Alphaproteobacteria bacterium]